jgi:predicted site-specific integrase-resolvase
MKSAEVLKLLKITRQTLTSYIKTGKITATKLGNGYYDYDDDSIYKFLNRDDRINVIYGRVSTYKQKNDLANQILNLINFCNQNKIKYTKIFQEIASGVDFDRKEFSNLIDMVFNKKIANIYITNKDRLSRLSFLTLENMFKQFGTKIIVINDKDSSYEDELFEELINIIHLFSTKIYSNRRKNIINKFETKLNKEVLNNMKNH